MLVGHCVSLTTDWQPVQSVPCLLRCDRIRFYCNPKLYKQKKIFGWVLILKLKPATHFSQVEKEPTNHTDTYLM